MRLVKEADLNTATISEIRNGRNENPGFKTLQKISKFFGVQLNYFEAETPKEARKIIAERNAPHIALRTTSEGELTEEAKKSIREMYNWSERAEEAIREGKPLPPKPWEEKIN